MEDIVPGRHIAEKEEVPGEVVHMEGPADSPGAGEGPGCRETGDILAARARGRVEHRDRPGVEATAQELACCPERMADRPGTDPVAAARAMRAGMETGRNRDGAVGDNRGGYNTVGT